MAVIRMRKNLSNLDSYPNDTWREQCKPLQTVLKHFRLYILAQIV